MSRVYWLITFAAVLGLPLVSVYLKSGDIGFVYAFPPEFGRLDHVGFKPKLTLLALTGCCVLPVLWVLVKRRDRIYRHPLVIQRRHFPKWGYWGYLLLVASWIVAWTRLPIFSVIQIYTFTPIWLGFILVVNAHVHQRSNTAPIYKAPGKFALLFLLSALFWWGFEYLNRFTDNWIYTGATELSAAHYYIHGSVCFSTVLPAVYSVFRWLNGYNQLHRTLFLGPRIALIRSRVFGSFVFLTGIMGMLGVGLIPQYCYPFLWIGPLLIYGGLHSFFGNSSFASAWSRGDWRWVAFWAMAGLICGVFWELWNFYSLLRWEYQVSFFNGWRVFEMPILGYLGYLPFGVFCGLACQWIFNNQVRIEFSPNE